MYNKVRYEANEGRQNRVSAYKKYCSLPEDYRITEEDLNDYALDYVSCYYNCPKNRLRCELLGEQWSEYEGR